MKTLSCLSLTVLLFLLVIRFPASREGTIAEGPQWKKVEETASSANPSPLVFPPIVRAGEEPGSVTAPGWRGDRPAGSMAPAHSLFRSRAIASLVGAGTVVSVSERPFVPLKGEMNLPALRTPEPLTRRTTLLEVPDFKYPRVRVDQVLAGSPGGEVVLHEAAMVADHVLVRVQGVADWPVGTVIRRWVREPDIALADVPLVDAPADALHDAIATLERSSVVAEPDYLVFVSSTPNDSRFSELWGLNDIGAPMAWARRTTATDILIAVIDTGIQLDHPDLQQSLWKNPGESGGGKENNGRDDDGDGFVDNVHGWDFVNNDNDPSDDHGHGTHCAGTIGATGNNGTGVTGVLWQGRVMALKFLDRGGRGATSDAIGCIDLARRKGVKVMNNSWGGGGYSAFLEETIRATDDAGALFVAAAGNDNSDNDQSPHYPASYPLPNILSVASITSERRPSDFSNWGQQSVHLAAPGSAILSTLPGGGYGFKNGTSMAAPHVAGALALAWAHHQNWQHWEVRRLILDKVERLPVLNNRVSSGGTLSIGRLFDGGGLPPGPPVFVSASLACGADHFLHLRPDGSVLQWGGGRATPEPVAGLTDATAVAAGTNVQVQGGFRWNTSSLSAAIRRDGSVVHWSGYGTPAPVPGLDDIVEIALGSAQLLARRSDGTVWTWGRAYLDAGLGDGSTNTVTTTAVPVSGISNAIALAAGESHNLVLLSDGSVCAWGFNEAGQIGDGTVVSRAVPVPVAGLTGVVAVAAGHGVLNLGATGAITGNHSLALRSDGTVWGWGYNRDGELGSSPSATLTPRPLDGLSGIRRIAGGRHTTFAINALGEVFAMGANGYGTLGLGHVNRVTSPRKIPGLTGVASVAAGEFLAGALRQDGSVIGWGSASAGALAGGIFPERTYRPVDPGLRDVVAIAAGYTGSAFLDADGHVWETGSSMNPEFYKPLLTGASHLNVPQRSSYTGVQSVHSRDHNRQYELMIDGRVRRMDWSGYSHVPGLTGAVSIDTRGWAGAAIRTDGTLWTWGQETYGNERGKLGDGTTVSRAEARRVDGLSGVLAVSVGESSMLAVTRAGMVYGWGGNASGQIGDGTTQNRLSPVELTALAGRGVVQVAAGSGHGVARTSGGEVFAWGDYRTCGFGTTRLTPARLTLPESIVDISAGYTHTLAVGASGVVYSWGVNTGCALGYGSVSDSPTPVTVSLITNAVKVSADYDHSIALLADGTVRLWGNNQVGQVGDGQSRRESPTLIIPANGATSTQTLNFAASSTDNWPAAHFTEPELRDPAVSGDPADPDGDGLSNLMEYVLGTNPRTADNSASLIEWRLAPHSSDVAIPSRSADAAGPLHLTGIVRLRATRLDAVITAEVSPDLKTWHGPSTPWLHVVPVSAAELRFLAADSAAVQPQLFGRFSALRRP